MSSPGGHHFGTKTWAYPTAFRFQCWDTSGQTTSWLGMQPHPSTDRMPKVERSSQPPVNTPLDMTLPTRGTRPSSIHQWAGTSPSHQEACTSLWPDLTHQKSDIRSKRKYIPAACRKETTNTKFDKMRWPKNMVQTKEQENTEKNN